MESCHAILADDPRAVVELLDPAASSTEYEFINGRFVEVEALSLLDNTPSTGTTNPPTDNHVLQHCKEFENLLLDKKAWRLFVESWERDFIKH
jgi:hypothetical protein